jgi:hypothetical protein
MTGFVLNFSLSFPRAGAERSLSLQLLLLRR